MVIADYQINGRKTVRRVEESYAHLVPYFGQVPAAQLGLRSTGYIEHRLAEGAAAATVRLELMNLSRGLTLAVRAGLLPYRPSLSVPVVRNTRRSAIPEDQIDALLAYLPSDVRDVVEMGYLTGWRRSEILGLRWSNVDRHSGVIRLDPGSTKNGDGRVFPYGVLPRLEALLRNRSKKTIDVETRLGIRVPFVFHRSGEPIRRFTRSWKTACRRAGLEGFVFHDLRRSAATNMVRAGVPIRTAMAILGHKTRSIFDRYTIVSEEDLKHGVQRYADRMAGSRPRIPL